MPTLQSMFELGFILGNRYQLKECFSQNSGRETWLAEDLKLSEKVVVKLLFFGAGMFWDDLKLFEREAEVLQQLSHPLIPKYRDYFSVDEPAVCFALVQDYIPGVSLKKLLEEKRSFSEEEVRNIAGDVLDVLIYLHGLTPAVLHRDIKPSNLILGEDGKVFLVDFGAVQNQMRVSGSTFTVVGTYGYAPVEQYGGQAATASDLYALGATIIHLITGIAPADLPLRELRIQFEERVGRDVSLYFVRWLERMTEPTLERRFKSAVQARDAIAGRLSIGGQSERYEGLPVGTRVVLNVAEGKLEISIPARVEVEVFEPVKLILTRGWDRFKRGLKLLVDNLKNSSLFARSPGLVRVGFVGGGLVLVGIGFPAIFSLIPFLGGLLFFGVCFAAGNWLGRSRSYFERTYVCFDSEKFVIEFQEVWAWSYRRFGGETREILGVSVGPFSEGNGPALLAVILRVGMFSGRLENLAFGQELSEAELNELVRVIGDWLGLAAG
ncbi:serine/threonine protein kinase [Ancylothrix sp. C2]|uniref:serine/threonine protein kinase n=1 Tax=Ancylothrix sp. D3o TaxID=2953691 RepID=UPI0021BAE9A7|nr:serine/threonine-protein kinase [Ancylothrix sp. D3o]MCT7950415.1 serine/threonine protein kinase [Ancylothrix sp. D3o]